MQTPQQKCPDYFWSPFKVLGFGFANPARAVRNRMLKNVKTCSLWPIEFVLGKGPNVVKQLSKHVREMVTGKPSTILEPFVLLVFCNFHYNNRGATFGRPQRGRRPIKIIKKCWNMVPKWYQSSQSTFLENFWTIVWGSFENGRKSFADNFWTISNGSLLWQSVADVGNANPRSCSGSVSG